MTKITRRTASTKAIGNDRQVYTVHEYEEIINVPVIGGTYTQRGRRWLEADGMDVRALGPRKGQIVATGVLLTQVGD